MSGTNKVINLQAITEFIHYITDNGAPFATGSALAAFKPAGEAGDYAQVVSTNSFWIWDSTNSQWRNSDTTGAESASDYRDFNEAGKPAAPLTGKRRLRISSDGDLYSQDSAGNEKIIANAGVKSSPNGYNLDGSTGRISVLDNDNLDFAGTTFSLEVIVQVPTVINTEQYILSKGINGYMLEFAPANLLSLGKRDVTSWATVSVAGYLGKIIHVVAGFDGTNAFIYINGVLKYNAAQSTDLIAATAANVIIGSYNGTLANLTTPIYSVKVYNRALTAIEVATHFNNGQPDLYIMPYSDRGASQTELVTNGDFGSATGWSTGFGGGLTIGNGVSTYDGTSGTSGLFRNDISIIKGKKYRLKFTINSGTARILFSISAGTSVYNTAANYTPGTYTIEFTASVSGNFGLIAYDSAGGTAFEMDNLSLIQLGNVLDLNTSGIGHLNWKDVSGNNLHGFVTGECYPILEPEEEFFTTGNFTTDIASGIANKDVSCPKNYIMTLCSVHNTLSSGSLTNVQCIDQNQGVTLFSALTIGVGLKLCMNGIPAFQFSAVSGAKTLRFNYTGNGAGGSIICGTFKIMH